MLVGAFCLAQADEITISPGEQLGQGFRPTNTPAEFGECYLDGDQAILTHSLAGSDESTAHVFLRGASGWEHEASLSDLAIAEPFNVANRAHAVRIDGDFALVSADGESSRRVVHAFERSEGTWTYLETLHAPDDDLGNFGYAIDLQGGTAVIASFEYRVTPLSLGSIYCYVRENGSWRETQRIRGMSQIYAIGSDVDLDGDRMVIGNFKRVGLFTGPDNRLDYYRRDANGFWREEQRIGTAGGSEYFGQRARLSGNWLAIRTLGGVVLHEEGPGGWEFRQEIAFPPYPDNRWSFDPLDGAFALRGDDFFVEMPHDGERRSSNGRWESMFREFAEFPDGVIHHYRRNGSAWEFVGLLEPAEGGLGRGLSGNSNDQGRFASSISFSEGRCLINDRIYEKNGFDQWIQTARLGIAEDLDNPAAFETFGYSVAISGDLAVVGAPRQDSGGVAFGGIVHTFTRNESDGWTRGPAIRAPNAAVGDRFGNAVKLHGTSLIVGAPRTDRLGHINLGSGYLYSWSGDDWMLQSELIPPPTGERGQFGTSVAISDSFVALGACFADPDGKESAGAVAVFDRASTGSPPRLVTAFGGMAGDQFGRSVDLDGNELFVGAPFHGVSDPRPAGSVFVFEKQQGVWVQSAVLAGQTGGERFGWSLAAQTHHLVVGSPAFTLFGPESGWASGAGSFYEKGPDGWALVLRTGHSGRLDYSDPDPLFGKSVAISGSRAVFSYEGRLLFGGRLDVYELENDSWTKAATHGDIIAGVVAIDGESLVACQPHEYFEVPESVRKVGAAAFINLDKSEPVAPRLFSAVDHAPPVGRAVAIWGHTAMVATTLNSDSFGSAPGRVMSFFRDPTGWHQTGVLSLPTHQANQNRVEQFGTRIALYGDTAAIGDGTETHIYIRDGLEWYFQQTISGKAVGLHGDRMVTSSGRIYRRSDRLRWEHVADFPVTGTIREIELNDAWVGVEVFENNSSRLELFLLDEGNSVVDSKTFAVAQNSGLPGDLALGDDIVIVTIWSYDPFRSNEPLSVYYSTLAGGSWSELSKLESESRSKLDGFGSSLSISDGLALIGTSTGGRGNAGQCHLLRWDGLSWQDETIFIEPQAVASGGFGRSVSLSGGVAVVGSLGRAHVFDLSIPDDQDGDRLPDRWETQFGLSTTDNSLEHTGFGNPDGDRWSNLEEYLLGTDPRVPETPSPLLPVSILDEDGVSLGEQPSYDFGHVARGGSASITLKIRNNSASEIQFFIPSTISNSYGFSTDLTGWLVLPPNRKISMTVRFAPTAVGVHAASITIGADPTDPVPLEISFAGSSTEPPQGYEPDYAPEVYGNVRCLCIQPDGKVLIGGQRFRTGTNQTGLFVARLNSDGSLDDSFIGQLPASAYQGNSGVNCLAVQDDGKILLGGAFGKEDGTVGAGILRLEANGAHDAGFTSPVRPISGVFNGIYSISIGAEGDILAGGLFMLDDGTFGRLIRLKLDGRKNPDFFSAPNSDVTKVIRQQDGKVLILGRFGSVNGIAQPYIARLEASGEMDPLFRVSVNSPLDAMALTSGGQVVLGGDFATVNGVARPHVARMSPSGIVDATFSLLPESPVGALAIQANGGIFIAADTFDFGDQTGENIARVHSDGGHDPDFPSHVNLAGIRSMSLDTNGKLLFIKHPLKGPLRAHAGPVTDTHSLSPNSTVTWLRGGALPETQQVKFRISLDEGKSWFPLGIGTRIPGGWELATDGLPPGSLISATARVENGSSSLVGSRSSVRVPSDGLTAIERWRLQHYGSAKNSGTGADDHAPAGDGITNLMRFATGHSPTEPAGDILVARRTSEGIELTYQRSTIALWSGITYAIETSTNLIPGNWELIEDSAHIADGEMVTLTLPRTQDTSRYFRLKVTTLENDQPNE